jgi:hypothetical protein
VDTKYILGITHELPVFGERFPSDESLRKAAGSCSDGGLRLLVAFDLLLGVAEDIVPPVGAIVAYGLEWSMDGGPRLAVTAEATAVVMIAKLVVAVSTWN